MFFRIINGNIDTKLRHTAIVYHNIVGLRLQIISSYLNFSKKIIQISIHNIVQQRLSCSCIVSDGYGSGKERLAVWHKKPQAHSLSFKTQLSATFIYICGLSFTRCAFNCANNHIMFDYIHPVVDFCVSYNALTFDVKSELT